MKLILETIDTDYLVKKCGKIQISYWKEDGKELKLEQPNLRVIV